MYKEDIEPLTIGISSGAIFDTSDQHEVWSKLGTEQYKSYQAELADIPLPPGPAFEVIRQLLRCNQPCNASGEAVEIVLMSKNSLGSSERVLNSIEHYGLDVGMASLTAGESLARYAKAYDLDLFLTADVEDSEDAAAVSVPTGLIYPGRHRGTFTDNEIRIALDGDAVIFSDEADRVHEQYGWDSFLRNEIVNSNVPLGSGPLARFLRKLIRLNLEHCPCAPKIRVALVTSRNLKVHRRVATTLESWGVDVAAHFRRGKSKTPVLQAFGPHIFLDDQQKHCEKASGHVPTARAVQSNNSQRARSTVKEKNPRAPYSGPRQRN